METVKINLGKAISALNEVKVKLMREEDGMLLIVFSERVYPKITVGTELVFNRDVYEDNGANNSFTRDITVLDTFDYTIDDQIYEAVYTTIPSKTILNFKDEVNLVTIKPSSADCTDNFDGFVPNSGGYLTVKTENGFGAISSIAYFSGETPFFIVEFAQEHKIFPQDIEVVSGGVYVNVYGVDGDKIGELSGITIPFSDTSKSIDSADTIITTYEEGCGYSADFRTHRYAFSRSNFSKTKIKFTLATAGKSVDEGKTFKEIVEYLINNGRTFTPNFNPMYHYSMGNLSEKECTLWTDPWWPSYSAMNASEGTREIYINEGGDSRAYLGTNAAYWNIPSLQFASENTSMGQEDEIKTSYVDDIIARSIPDVVDMERLKYKPAIFGENDAYKLVKSLIFDFHFRQRRSDSTYIKNTPYQNFGTEWAIGDDYEETKSMWNNMTVGMGYEYNKFSSGMMKTFIENRGSESDLLGFLNFVDDDVYYRKSKLSKSFVRLSFYTSTDPIEQKLLYYSTIFLDATSLYGKYMKIMMHRQDVGTDITTLPSVYYTDNMISERLDTEIVVKDEYNTERSSEGFNIYLFGDDANGINSARTIYMKVEFNHAGHGKTIPMLMWPKVEIDTEDDSIVAGFSNILGEQESTLLFNDSTLLGALAPSPKTELSCVCNREGEDAVEIYIPCRQTDACPPVGCNDYCGSYDCGIDCTNCTDCPSDCSSDYCVRDCTRDIICVSPVIEGNLHYDAPRFDVYGYVKDEQGYPISLAAVSIDGVSITAITDNNGYFSIYSVAVPITATITATRSGYETASMKLFIFQSGDGIITMHGIPPCDGCTEDCSADGCSEDGCPEDCTEDGCGEDGCTEDGCPADAPSPTKEYRYVPLTIANYLESLYIPIEIKYINNEYVYSIKGAKEEGDNLRLILFEPKLYNEDNL